MEWHKWTEIENLETEKRKVSKSFQYANSIKNWVVTEKIDGTNFGLNITKEDFQFNSRNQLLGKMSLFYNIYSNIDMFKPLIEFAQKEIIGRDAIEQVTFQGEYFGQKVLNRIDYRIPYSYRLFGMYYVIDGTKQTCSFEHLESVLKHCGLSDKLVPILETVTHFDKAIQYPNNKPSTFNEKIEMEGIVIMPYSIPYNYEGYDLIFKNKNQAFEEKSHRGKKEPEEIDDSILALKEKFKDYITESRMYSVISKIGKPVSEKDYGKYVNPFIEDAYKDFLKDNPVNLTDKERKIVTNIGNMGFVIFSVIVEKFKNS